MATRLVVSAAWVAKLTWKEISSLTMQRNAIAMLYDRVVVLVKYIQGVIDGEFGGALRDL